MADCLLYDAVRAPFGRYGGALAAVRTDDLAAHVVRELVTRAPGLDPAQIDDDAMGEQTLHSHGGAARGGAIAIGHPLGASGARILGTLAHELHRRRGGYGLAAMRIGVGQGLAVVIHA